MRLIHTAEKFAQMDEKPFLVKPSKMGLRPDIDETKLNQLVDELDGNGLTKPTQRLEF